MKNKNCLKFEIVSEKNPNNKFDYKRYCLVCLLDRILEDGSILSQLIHKEYIDDKIEIRSITTYQRYGIALLELKLSFFQLGDFMDLLDTMWNILEKDEEYMTYWIHIYNRLLKK